jgi:hypothetical protein
MMNKDSPVTSLGIELFNSSDYLCPRIFTHLSKNPGIMLGTGKMPSSLRRISSIIDRLIDNDSSNQDIVEVVETSGGQYRVRSNSAVVTAHLYMGNPSIPSRIIYLDTLGQQILLS